MAHYKMIWTEMSDIHLIEINSIPLAYKTYSDLEYKDEKKELLFKEIQILKGLEHPNIIDIVDKKVNIYEEEVEMLKHSNIVENMEPKLGFLMPRADMDLDAFIRAEQHLGFEHFILASIGKGLDYLHKKGIIHNDIKLQNIVMFGTIPKIIDFGSATIVDDIDYDELGPGTPGYIAPEILLQPYDADDPIFDEKVDVWSFAVVVWQVMNNSTDLIFEGDTRQNSILETIKYVEVDWINLPGYMYPSLWIQQMIPRIERVDKLDPLSSYGLVFNPLERPSMADYVQYIS